MGSSRWKEEGVTDSQSIRPWRGRPSGGSWKLLVTLHPQSSTENSKSCMLEWNSLFPLLHRPGSPAQGMLLPAVGSSSWHNYCHQDKPPHTDTPTVQSDADDSHGDTLSRWLWLMSMWQTNYNTCSCHLKLKWTSLSLLLHLRNKNIYQ